MDQEMEILQGRGLFDIDSHGASCYQSGPQQVFVQVEVHSVQLAPVRLSLKKSTSTLPGRSTVVAELVRYCSITAAMFIRLCGAMAGKAVAIPDTLQQQ